MAQVKLTEARLRQIHARQWVQRWGANYVASTFADAREAPGISSASILRPRKLGEREFHTLSEPETFCALLALFHTNCFDLHEQGVLFPNSRPHPLSGHPLANGLQFSPFKGTLDVSRRLGVRHPRIRLANEDEPAKWPFVPFPYTGDLRLFMRGSVQAYCVNWSVKDKYEDFRRKGPRGKPRPLNDQDDPVSVLRQELEKIYNEDAEIRTVLVSKDQIDKIFIWNLRDVFLDDNYPICLSEEERTDAIILARKFIGSTAPIYEIARTLAANFSIDKREACALVYQGIWRRELRVDLFRPVSTVYPLRLERVDPLERYASWFVQ